MKRHLSRCSTASVTVTLGLAALAGCSSDEPSSPAASSAASAVKSGVSERASAASSAAASVAASAVASAEAEADAALAKVKGGLDATADVALGSVATASNGPAEVPVNVTNNDAKPRRYTIVVDFKDQSGNALDVVTLEIPEVAAAGKASATARSHRDLTGTVTAEVRNALRY
ncbi:hypothetical protein OG596_19760 [Streptomyces sp. NBC_01102]|uniref:hypothetical protein n=1 Tax=unclassified Streptomyces TaxID=2593676 RepID=UPI0038637156|nr:hypothetical protein OG596_19760 [Streptomyces sp. NBC_01102]